MASKNKERLSQEDIKARLMFLIGAVLSFVFLINSDAYIFKY
jgi:hypothetical protein